MNAAAAYLEPFAETIIPPERLSLSEWAELKAYLSPESSADPGKWSAYPYQVGILDAFTDPLVEEIDVMKSARVGFTKCINHALAFHIEHDQCSQLIVQPTVEDAKGYSKDELAPMLRDTPCLSGLVADSVHDSDNTLTRKAYPGGFLVLIGANSPRGFRRLTVRCVYLDEVDGYPVSAGKEGDPIKLAVKRSFTFWNRKIMLGSTPTLKGLSRIEAAFDKSDQRRYFVPCPHCKGMQFLKWGQMRWPDNDPDRAFYRCEHCEQPIPHTEKRWMVERGVWQPTWKNPETDEIQDTWPDDVPKPVGKAGFHIWSAYSYSPNAAWGKLAREFLESKDDFEMLKTFVNTVLGETFEIRGESASAPRLLDRAELFEKDVAPEGVLCITAGADVQKDRIECEIVGWGHGMESWSLDYVVLYGDPLREDVWNQLSDVLFTRQWEQGTDDSTLHMSINATCIDSGYATNEVYRFCMRNLSRRVYPTKGKSTFTVGEPIVTESKRKFLRQPMILGLIGTETAKDIVYASLKTNEPGPNFCHFPDHYPEKYFKMLTAEHRVRKLRNGVPYYSWVLKSGHRRNEALDCRVNALAAIHILNPQFAKIERNLKLRIVKNKEKMGENERKRKNKRKKGGFVNKWR